MWKLLLNVPFPLGSGLELFVSLSKGFAARSGSIPSSHSDTGDTGLLSQLLVSDDAVMCLLLSCSFQSLQPRLSPHANATVARPLLLVPVSLSPLPWFPSFPPLEAASTVPVFLLILFSCLWLFLFLFFLYFLVLWADISSYHHIPEILHFCFAMFEDRGKCFLCF